MLPERERFSVGNDRRDGLPGSSLSGECERDIDFGILRKCLCVGSVDARPVSSDGVRALVVRGDGFCHVVPVAHEKLGCIDDQALTILCDDRERCGSARRKSLEDGSRVSGIVQRRLAVVPVLEDDEDAVPVFVETRDVGTAARPAVEADRIRSEPGGEADEHQRSSRVARDLQVNLPLPGIEVQRNESVASLHSSCLRLKLRSGRGFRTGCGRCLVLRRGRCAGHGTDDDRKAGNCVSAWH